MTDATNEPADARTNADATADPHALADGQEDPRAPPASADVAALRREAANYRRRLRDAERERDALAERVRGSQRMATEGRDALATVATSEPWPASRLPTCSTTTETSPPKGRRGASTRPRVPPALAAAADGSGFRCWCATGFAGVPGLRNRPSTSGWQH